ncbi:glycosyltransferase family 4 protein [Psychroflexus aestuariivivens]|uniref:glycosyltransferase family 4 protein n=1 Tax=Psychroflexus aestuariivivens TaxID=1795040 RepID=UPI000FD6BB2B|nr:glycosyltransferase [Psychroflexus aestuariivivens]
MKIIINTAHQRFGGAIQVALSFINECKNFPKHEYHVWIGYGVSKSIKTDSFPDNFQFYHFDFGVINFKKIKLIQNQLSALEHQIIPDVLISTSGPTYFHSKAPQIIGFNLPLYIYPESPYVQEMSWKSKLKLALKRKAHFYYFKRDAAAYVTQTDDVNQRVRKALDTDQVFTVTNTASNYYKDWEVYPKRLPEKPKDVFRLICISSYYPHKNLELIPEMLEELKQKGINNIEFVLTLQSDDYKTYIGHHPQIHNVGPIPPEACPSLYHECDALFLPTLAECFSASYPEAMMMKKPIVTTDLGFAKSICGEAALYFEPKDARSAADQIEKLLENTELQKDLVAKGDEQLKTFDSPQDRAKKYIELCKSLAKRTTE